MKGQSESNLDLWEEHGERNVLKFYFYLFKGKLVLTIKGATTQLKKENNLTFDKQRACEKPLLMRPPQLIMNKH